MRGSMPGRVEQPEIPMPSDDTVRRSAEPDLKRFAAALRGAALAGCVALLLTPAGVRGQAGSVVGSVYDSINGEPLVDAAVFLWETSHRAATDAEGRYRMEGVEPGSYSILFFHTRLGELGISPGPRPIVVDSSGRETVIDLAMPSMQTVIASECLFEERPPGTGVLAGWVRDETSDVRIVGSSVVFAWPVPDERTPEELVLTTGPGGWYHACAAPAGVPMLGSVSFYGREAARREIMVEDGGFTEADFDLNTLRPSTVVGRLLDAATDKPVDGAEVWLRGTSERVLTNDDGMFTLAGVQTGTYMMMVDHLAYGSKMDTLEVPTGQRLSVQMRLDTRPIPIAPVTVEVEASHPVSAGMTGGLVIPRQRIDEVRQRSRDVSDVLRSMHVPGLIIRQPNAGDLCVGYSAGQVRLFDDGCAPMLVFVNDVRATDPAMALRLPPESIERMVIYKPIEAGNLFGLGGGNGVLMIYTRGN